MGTIHSKCSLESAPTPTTLRPQVCIPQAEGWTIPGPMVALCVLPGSEVADSPLRRGTQEVSPGNPPESHVRSSGHLISACFLVERALRWPETTWSGLPNTSLSWRAGRDSLAGWLGQDSALHWGAPRWGLQGSRSGRGASQVPLPQSPFPGAPLTLG